MKGGSKGNLISGGNHWSHLIILQWPCVPWMLWAHSFYGCVSETFWSCCRQCWTTHQQGSFQECWGTCSSSTCRQTLHASPLCCQVRHFHIANTWRFNARLILSTCFSSLPKVIKRRLKALKKLQVEVNHLEAAFFEELHKLECQYQAKYQSLYDKVQGNRIEKGTCSDVPGAEFLWHFFLEGRDCECQSWANRWGVWVARG